MRVYANCGGLFVWFGNRRGFKIERERDFLFSDRYVHRVIQLLGQWRLVLASPPRIET